MVKQKTEPKTVQLRRMLEDGGTHFLLEAHDGISARIVEQAGFEGIWGSGLAIAASLGVRDNNEASWTQVLEVVEFMSDATSVPILLDGDTGYGNFNNARRLIRKLEQRGVAGVCIEDKVFPKTNSFIGGERQPLADAEEFAGKIYHAAGADALLIHSKVRTAHQVLEFKRLWGDRCPVVIVPTMYYSTPTEAFEQAGFGLVIWANHMLRSAVASMQDTAAKIHRDRSLHQVEDEVVPVSRIFELQGAQELAEAERRYLPETRLGMHTIVLAAGRGGPFGALTEELPKCMLAVGGRPILEKQLTTLRAAGLRAITVVRGHAKDKIAFDGVDYVDNDAFAETRCAWSLDLALADREDPLLIAFGDILYRGYVLAALLEQEGDVVVVVDLHSTDREAKPGGDYVMLPDGRAERGLWDDAALELAGVSAAERRCDGELIGLVKTTARGTQVLRDALAELSADGRLERAGLCELVERMLARGESVQVVPIAGNWVDVNRVADLSQASEF